MVDHSNILWVLKLVYREKVFIKCAGERLECNFSKFYDKHLEKNQKHIVETLSSVAVASSNATERYVLNHEEPFSDEEKEAL
jgi:hypothetical protein